MKVLHVNATDSGGGAAIACYRLHRALLHDGVDSTLLVQSRDREDGTVAGPSGRPGRLWARLRKSLDLAPLVGYPLEGNPPFSPAWVPFGGVPAAVYRLDPDIVHLHWITGGMMRIEQIARLGRPVVWTLHDNWAFTGGCHIKGDCERYREGCGRCPVLGSGRLHDRSRSVYRRKRRTLARTPNLTAVGVSRWLADCARTAPLLEGHRIVHLPNPIDTGVFRPLPRADAREMLGIPPDRKVVLFGAVNPARDRNKGFDLLVEALDGMEEPGVELAIFGAAEGVAQATPRVPIRLLGRRRDELSLRTVYSAADVTVVPSRQEAFGQTAVESMACGTPVVAFGATGLTDIVDHRKNGWLATPFEPADLAAGIAWALRSPDAEAVGEAARAKVCREFDAALVAGRYRGLYGDILKQAGGG